MDKASASPPDISLRLSVAAIADRGRLAAVLDVLRPSLLYGDVVALTAPGASILSALGRSSGLTTRQRREFLRAWASDLSEDTGNVQLNRDGVEDTIDVISKHDPADIDALTKLIANGVVEIHGGFEDFDVWLNYYVVSKMFRDESAGYLMDLTTTVTSRGVPVLDDWTHQVFTEGHPVTWRQRGSRSLDFSSPDTFAADLAHLSLGALPGLGGLSIRSIVELREELKRPLIRFRSDLHSLAGVEVAQEDMRKYRDDVRRSYMSKIQPALLDIDDAISANALVRRLTSSLTSWQVGPRSVLGLLLGRLAELSPASAGLATLGVTATGAAHDAVELQRAERRRIQTLPFYFLRGVSNRAKET